VQWAEKQLPPDAVVLTGLLSGAFYYYTERLTFRWDELKKHNRTQRLQATTANVFPWYAVLSDAECTAECLQQVVPGRWTSLGRNRDITLWRYEGR
jgi:hypothetical protein